VRRPLSRAALALALALSAAPAPAVAYVRTADKATGQPLSWPLPAVPWHLNRDFPYSAPSCRASAGEPILAAVRASFAQWEQSCTDLRLLYAGDSSEIRVGSFGHDENVVVFRRGWCSQHPLAKNDPCMTSPDGDCSGIYDCFQDSPACIGQTSCATDWGIVALTSVLYDPATGRIMSADIEVNGWDGVAGTIGNPPGSAPQHGWYFTCETPGVAGTCAQRGDCCTTYGQEFCFSIDLQNTVTHEVGHFLGLAHTPVAGATMNATTAPREIAKRDLALDDVAGICAIYPSSGGGCGCTGGGAGGAVSLALLAGAALALRPRRPRRGSPLTRR
jgi:uncharacterized protein (TIGR03382 family)